MIPRFIQVTLGLAVVLGSAAAAEEHAPELKTAGYHLKKQSTFKAAPSVRAPFWPIGWTPTAKGTATVDAPAPELVLKPEQFSVTSILLGSQSLAVINGRTYGEGEFLRMAKLGKPAEGVAPGLPAGVKIRVNRIVDGQVVLQAGAQVLTVTLRRPQLLEKKPGEEDLLSQVGER